MKNEIELSVIIPTLGRKQEFEDLLNSFRESIGNINYEIIVVDQNEDGLIDSICQDAADLNIIQKKVEFKGSSRARNYGIDHAKGKYICFPDDDAEFRNDTIEHAMKLLKENDYDCVFGKCIDKSTQKDSVMSFNDVEQVLTLDNFEGSFIEATMFAKKNMFNSCKYDEKMGAGCILGSQEGYDLVYRLLKEKKKMFFTPEIVFFHPQKIETKMTDAEIKRAFYYSCGFGYLCRKHNFVQKYKKRMLLLNVGMPVIAVLKRNELKYYKAQRMGLILGYGFLA